MPEEDLALLTKAHAFAEQFYSGKHRLSGLPYLYHTLVVTDILATMCLDVPTLCAGLLHGVLKKADNLKETEKTLRETFGDDITNIVKGATKITDVQFNSRLAYQAENIRKLLLAMSSDIRVLLVKLADRLHDMQSLQHVARDQQLEFAQETMDLYAPLAGRLGIDWIKRELEDFAFSYLNPEDYQYLAGKISASLTDREEYVERIKELLTRNLRASGLADFEILGRPKHLYSIHKKLKVQNITLDKVYDKVAFRIIVHTVQECYQALGVIHSLWPPIDGRFKDFISHPKANGYQSVHTSVIGPNGDFMEIQIRTEEMDQIAKEGIAAHWAYKEGKAATSRDVKLFKWLKQLVGMLQELEDPKELLETVKGELYEDEIYVLTPTGEVKGFPKGSTPLDFAYAIHTEVGNRCTGAKVSGQISPLRTPLKNGDVVEIITSPNQQPNRNWLNLVKTARARNRIRQWLNQQEREQHLRSGREICERALRKHNISLKRFIKTGHLKEILKSLASNTVDDLMRKVGAGKLTVAAILRLLQPEELRRKEEAAVEAAALERAPSSRGAGKGKSEEIIRVEGASGILTKIANCCLPVPGDEIVGFITAGRGITVHKAGCPNLLASEPERRIGVSWAAEAKTSHRASIQIMARDQKGLLAAVSNSITGDDANIVHLEAATLNGGMARFQVVVEVASLDHLGVVLQHLQQLDGVSEARRK